MTPAKLLDRVEQVFIDRKLPHDMDAIREIVAIVGPVPNNDAMRLEFEAEKAKTYQENVESLRFANEMFPGQSETKQWYGAYFFHAGRTRRPVASVVGVKALSDLVLDVLQKPLTLSELAKLPHERIAERIHALLTKATAQAPVSGVVKCDCEKKCDRDAVVSFVDDIEPVTVHCCSLHARAYRRNPDTWRETAILTTAQGEVEHSDECLLHDRDSGQKGKYCTCTPTDSARGETGISGHSIEESFAIMQEAFLECKDKLYDAEQALATLRETQPTDEVREAVEALKAKVHDSYQLAVELNSGDNAAAKKVFIAIAEKWALAALGEGGGR